MSNLEWLEKKKEEDIEFINEHMDMLQGCYEFRKIKALEIIAEELVRLNNENLNWKL